MLQVKTKYDIIKLGVIMKSTVNKGILFYILLLCSIVVGIACVIMAILIFSPGTEIFGISYYGKKNRFKRYKNKQ